MIEGEMTMTIYTNAKDVVQEFGGRTAPIRPRIAQLRMTNNESGRIETTRVPVESDLPKRTRDAIDKIRVLQKYTADTGFKTTRSQNDMLQMLDGDDLANALLVLKYGQ
jgi:hypothetical protein